MYAAIVFTLWSCIASRPFERPILLYYIYLFQGGENLSGFNADLCYIRLDLQNREVHHRDLIGLLFTHGIHVMEPLPHTIGELHGCGPTQKAWLPCSTLRSENS
jgi:hypothetical protein